MRAGGRQITIDTNRVERGRQDVPRLPEQVRAKREEAQGTHFQG